MKIIKTCIIGWMILIRFRTQKTKITTHNSRIKCSLMPNKNFKVTLHGHNPRALYLPLHHTSNQNSSGIHLLQQPIISQNSSTIHPHNRLTRSQSNSSLYNLLLMPKKHWQQMLYQISVNHHQRKHSPCNKGLLSHNLLHSHGRITNSNKIRLLGLTPQIESDE